MSGRVDQEAPRRAQTTADVIRAESFRLRRPGGALRGLLVVGILAVLGGALALAILLSVAPAPTMLMVATPLELCAFMATTGAALVIAGAMGRDGRGQVAGALAVVPRRGRLHLGRAVTSGIGGAVVAAGACLAVAMVCVLASGGVTFLGVALLGLACAVFASLWLALLAFGIGTILRSSPAAVFIVIGLVVVLPLGVAGVAGVLPAGVAAVAESLAAVTPGRLLMDAVALSSLPGLGLGRILGGQLGLAVWGIAAAAAAGILFHRRDARID